jgi:hypothetical protein
MAASSTSTPSALRITSGAADHEFAHAAGAEAAPNSDALGLAPSFQLKKAADHPRKFLGKIFDRPLHHAGGLFVPWLAGAS